MRTCLDRIAEVVPGVEAWVSAVAPSAVDGVPQHIADLVAPLSGGVVVGRQLARTGDVLAAMVCDAVAGHSDAPWALGLQRALVRRSGAPLAWAGCLLDPARVRAELSVQIDGLSELCAWIGSHSVLPEIHQQLRRALIALMFSRPPAGIQLDAALQDAARRAPIDLSGRGEGTWEWQRSGFLGQPLLVGDLFGPLLLAEAASSAGLHAAPMLSRVLQGRDGLRYYRDCEAIPRDADDAAALLIADRACGGGVAPRALCEAARATLAAATVDGVHTWIDDAGQPTAWLGPRCVGVAARVVMATQDAEAGRWLAAQAQQDGCWKALHYPSAVYTTALAVRALRSMAGLPTIGAALEGGQRWLAAQQQPSGAIGAGCLETAEAIRSGGLDPSQQAEAAAFLLRRQQWDGQWPAETLYICPHPRDTMAPFGASALTTAMVVAALSAVGRALAAPAGG